MPIRQSQTESARNASTFGSAVRGLTAFITCLLASCDSGVQETAFRENMRRELEELGGRAVEVLRQDPDVPVIEVMKHFAPRNTIIKANEPFIIDKLAAGEIVVLFNTISREDLESFVPIAVQITPHMLKSETFVVVLYSEPEADVDALASKDLERLVKFTSPTEARDWLLSR